MPRDPAPPAGRPSFRRRLLLTLGGALAGTFVVLGLLTWLAAYGWLHYHNRALLKREADEIAFHIVTPEGRLAPENYAWGEPHHRFGARRIDPYFVQIFAPGGALLRASENIQTFPQGTYPDHLLDGPTPEAIFTPLPTLHAGDALLHMGIFPVDGTGGERLAYIQIARYEPGIAATLRTFTLVMLAAYGLLFGGLLLLIRSVAGRLVRPMETITRHTVDLSPRELGQRLPMPPDTDRETAQLTHTLNSLLARMEEAFEEMRRFTANAAHELQTPLTILRGHVDVSLRRPRPPEAYRDTLRMLGDEIDAMSRMVHSLLVLARLDRDRHIHDRTPVDLAMLVREEADRFAPRAGDRAFLIEAPNPCWTPGLPDLLREVVVNLLDNALKYTPSGRITVRLTASPETLELVVTDTGMGIPAEALPHVTDRFYRAPALQGSGVPGTGLGLSLVQAIVALHEGRLHIDSHPGEGTRVTVILPRCEAPADSPKNAGRVT